MSHSARKAFLGIGVVVYLAVFGYAMVNEYAPLAKRGDWARVGSFIQSNESAGQPILVFTTFDALTLPYHYRGVNAVLPDERYFDFITPQAKPGSLESLQAETEFALSELPAGVESFWLVVNEKCFSGEACTPLQNYVSANYTIEIEKSFYYEKVYLLRRKQQ